jgi:hypothetical protein
MKKSVVFLLLFGTVVALNAQVFNTGQTLKPKAISLGIEPAFVVNGDAQFMLFLHGGIGLVKGTDFGIKLGFLNGETYVGGDVEFALGKYLSASVGAHHWGNFGLDGTLLGTYTLRKGVRLFGGLDADINFARYDKDNDGDKDTDLKFLLWAPVGIEVDLRKNLAFIFEASIGLTDPAYHVIGGGVVIYF